MLLGRNPGKIYQSGDRFRRETSLLYLDESELRLNRELSEMPSIIAMNPFRCRMWEFHDRLETHINERTCRAEIASFSKHGQIVAVLGRSLHGDKSYDVELITGARRLFVELFAMVTRRSLQTARRYRACLEDLTFAGLAGSPVGAVARILQAATAQVGDSTMNGQSNPKGEGL
jgi:hypothetical protein